MYKIIWSAEALMQYKKVLNFWKKHNQSSSYSLKIVRTTNIQLQHLLHNPRMGVVVSNAKGIRRILILRKFSIFYKLENNTIKISSFWDNRQKPNNFT